MVSWKTKKQTVVAHSSAEAELRALACVTVEVTWLRWLLANFGISLTTPTTVRCDSSGAISIARDPIKHQLTKHIGIDCLCSVCSSGSCGFPSVWAFRVSA